MGAISLFRGFYFPEMGRPRTLFAPSLVVPLESDLPKHTVGAWRSLDSALQWGCRGRRFKSSRPDQFKKRRLPRTETSAGDGEGRLENVHVNPIREGRCGVVQSLEPNVESTSRLWDMEHNRCFALAIRRHTRHVVDRQ